jgi:PKHD-type hydroxylase
MMFVSIPPRHIHDSDNLFYWENFLTDSDIDTLLSLTEWRNTSEGLTGIDKGEINKKRKSQIAWHVPSEKTFEIWKKITDTIAHVNSMCFHYDLSGCYEPMQLTMYNSKNSEYYSWHVDSFNQPHSVPRKLSMTLLLSDPSEFKGGELQVMKDSENIMTLEQKKGRAWFFPSYMLHRVTPVTKGIRRSAVLWIGGPPFK